MTNLARTLLGCLGLCVIIAMLLVLVGAGAGLVIGAADIVMGWF